MAGPSGTTGTPLALPYPIPDDDVDVPRDIKALADRLNLLGGIGSAGGSGSPAAAKPVLDVGVAGQIRAGRQLAAADFTALGLQAPLGLWNLSDLTDASGNARALSNKGSVPFGPGINGLATTSAVFAGSTGQALYIADTGASDPFRIRTGSWGCWFRTAKRGATQAILSKRSTAGGQIGWETYVTTANIIAVVVSTTGSDAPGALGVSDVADDRWHLGVVTHDGTTTRIYVDGVLEATAAITAPMFGSSGAVNVGGWGADGSAAANDPWYGRVDEAFVTNDVLSDDQVRGLYCARLPHTLGAVPTRVTLNVRRRKRGGPLAVTDFPTQPLRLHNFTAGALTDEGSNGVALTNNNPTLILPVAGGDGAPSGAFNFSGAHTGLSATDAGLPSGTASRSYGAWFKTSSLAGCGIISWGASPNWCVIRTGVTGQLACDSGTDVIVDGVVTDGQWHHVVAVEDNAAGDGVRRKLYLDGRLVGTSTVLTSITLAGANRFRVGAYSDGTTSPMIGQVDGAFVHAAALTFEQVAALYAKGSQALGPSPKEPGAHIEGMSSTDVLCVFDTLDSTAQVDIGVAS